MEALEFVLKIVTIMSREESAWQTLGLGDAMLICSYRINLIAASWLYIAEDSSQGQRGWSFTACPRPAPWGPWGTQAAPAAENPACTARRDELLNQCVLSCPGHLPFPPSSAHFSVLLHSCLSPSGDFIIRQQKLRPDLALRTATARRM